MTSKEEILLQISVYQQMLLNTHSEKQKENFIKLISLYRKILKHHFPKNVTKTQKILQNLREKASSSMTNGMPHLYKQKTTRKGS